MQTMRAIISEHEDFLRESPRKHTVLVKNERGILACLFYSSLPDTPGVAIQFADDGLCYVVNDEARWNVEGVYENAHKFFAEKNKLKGSQKGETA